MDNQASLEGWRCSVIDWTANIWRLEDSESRDCLGRTAWTCGTVHSVAMAITIPAVGARLALLAPCFTSIGTGALVAQTFPYSL